MTVYLMADSLEELNDYTEQVQRSVRKNTVELDKCYLYQEEALNTILPIGIPFINVKRRFMPDVTTSNLATQVPFTNVDLRSSSPRAVYYGQNQLSKNPITLDRKKDLILPRDDLWYIWFREVSLCKSWRDNSDSSTVYRRPHYYCGS